MGKEKTAEKKEDSMETRIRDLKEAQMAAKTAIEEMRQSMQMKVDLDIFCKDTSNMTNQQIFDHEILCSIIRQKYQIS